MKNLILFTTFLLLFASCKKSEDTTNGGTDNYADPLVPENTGWKRVATINYSGKYVDAGIVPHEMTAYDISENNGALQVLYSEDKFENGDRFAFYFKATTPISGGADAAVTELPKMPSAVQFRPGTYNAETYDFVPQSGANFFFKLINETGQVLTTNNVFNYPFYHRYMRANGDLVMGGIYSTAALDMDYYNRAANTWTHNLQSNADTQYNIAYRPFLVVGDASPLAFRLYSKGTKAYMSVARFVQNTQYPAPPYTTFFTEEHPEYAPTSITGFSPDFPGETSIVAYNAEGNALTVVLSNKNKTNGAYTLSAYKWINGAVALIPLYRNVSVATDLGDKLAPGIFGKCTADGTVYALLDENSPTNNGRAYHLSLINANGEKTYGNAYSSSTRYVASISTLRYINGAFYACVVPQFSGVNYVGQHMDIVKLTP